MKKRSVNGQGILINQISYQTLEQIFQSLTKVYGKNIEATNMVSIEIGEYFGHQYSSAIYYEKFSFLTINQQKFLMSLGKGPSVFSPHQIRADLYMDNFSQRLSWPSLKSHMQKTGKNLGRSMICSVGARELGFPYNKIQPNYPNIRFEKELGMNVLGIDRKDAGLVAVLSLLIRERALKEVYD